MYEKNYDVDAKLDQFQMICGTINRMFDNKYCERQRYNSKKNYGDICTVL